jgi:hypothetical protein
LGGKFADKPFVYKILTLNPFAMNILRESSAITLVNGIF